MLPIIAVEINNTITEYKQLVERIQNADMSGHMQGQDGGVEEMTKYVQMRSMIKARMEELAVFYDEN